MFQYHLDINFSGHGHAFGYFKAKGACSSSQGLSPTRLRACLTCPQESVGPAGVHEDWPSRCS